MNKLILISLSTVGFISTAVGVPTLNSGTIAGSTITSSQIAANLPGNVVTNMAFVFSEAFGSVGNGNFVTSSGVDCTAALQAAINYAESTHGCVMLLSNRYQISSPLVITSSLSIRGVGCFWLMGSLTNIASAFIPTISPYISGSIIQQTTAGADVFQITNSSYSVDLSDFGITWSSNLCFLQTGYGINNTPNPLGGKFDQGLWASHWRDVTVFGTDTNHVSFLVINGVCNHYQALRSIGGGGMRLNNNNTNTPTGNSLLQECYFQQMFFGTNHVLSIDRTPGSAGNENLITLVQNQFQQVNGTFYRSAFPALATVPFPTTSQYCIYIGFASKYVNGVGNTFENGGNGSGGIYIDPSCLYVNLKDSSLAGVSGSIVGICSVDLNGQLPNLMTGPFDWSVNAADDTYANQIDALRFLDNYMNASSLFKWTLTTSQHYVRFCDTFSSSAYGWDWGTVGSNPSTFTEVGRLDQSGNLSFLGTCTGNGGGLTNLYPFTYGQGESVFGAIVPQPTTGPNPAGSTTNQIWDNLWGDGNGSDDLMGALFTVKANGNGAAGMFLEMANTNSVNPYGASDSADVLQLQQLGFSDAVQGTVGWSQALGVGSGCANFIIGTSVSNQSCAFGFDANTGTSKAQVVVGVSSQTTGTRINQTNVAGVFWSGTTFAGSTANSIVGLQGIATDPVLQPAIELLDGNQGNPMLVGRSNGVVKLTIDAGGKINGNGGGLTNLQGGFNTTGTYTNALTSTGFTNQLGFDVRVFDLQGTSIYVTNIINGNNVSIGTISVNNDFLTLHTNEAIRGTGMTGVIWQ